MDLSCIHKSRNRYDSQNTNSLRLFHILVGMSRGLDDQFLNLKQCDPYSGVLKSNELQKLSVYTLFNIVYNLLTKNTNFLFLHNHLYR